MGREAICPAVIGDWMGEGRLLLETDDLIFRGARRWTAPLKGIETAEARDGWLVVRSSEGSARFDLGAAAPRWAHAILNPRTRADKLDVKAGVSVLVLGLEADADFMAELRARTDAIDTVARKPGYDLVFLRVEEAAELERLASLRARIQPAGGIWVVHPKGRADLSHAVLTGAAKEAGLVDTKTARFSDTHTGLRFVIPKAQR